MIPIGPLGKPIINPPSNNTGGVGNSIGVQAQDSNATAQTQGTNSAVQAQDNTTIANSPVTTQAASVAPPTAFQALPYNQAVPNFGFNLNPETLSNFGFDFNTGTFPSVIFDFNTGTFPNLTQGSLPNYGFELNQGAIPNFGLDLNQGIPNVGFNFNQGVIPNFGFNLNQAPVANFGLNVNQQPVFYPVFNVSPGATPGVGFDINPGVTATPGLDLNQAGALNPGIGLNQEGVPAAGMTEQAKEAPKEPKKPVNPMVQMMQLKTARDLAKKYDELLGDKEFGDASKVAMQMKALGVFDSKDPEVMLSLAKAKPRLQKEYYNQMGQLNGKNDDKDLLQAQQANNLLKLQDAGITNGQKKPDGQAMNANKTDGLFKLPNQMQPAKNNANPLIGVQAGKPPANQALAKQTQPGNPLLNQALINQLQPGADPDNGLPPGLKSALNPLKSANSPISSVDKAFLLANLNPQNALQLAVGGFQPVKPSRAFTISGQQFLNSANPNLILGNFRESAALNLFG